MINNKFNFQSREHWHGISQYKTETVCHKKEYVGKDFDLSVGGICLLTMKRSFIFGIPCYKTETFIIFIYVPYSTKYCSFGW